MNQYRTHYSKDITEKEFNKSIESQIKTRIGIILYNARLFQYIINKRVMKKLKIDKTQLKAYKALYWVK